MKELTSPAREILDHLLQHPDACDTFDGIAHWWLLEQQLRTWLPRVEKAVEELVARGLLQATCGPDGVMRYRGNPEALAVAQREPAPRRMRRVRRRTPTPSSETSTTTPPR
jgi:hypothetical protein